MKIKWPTLLSKGLEGTTKRFSHLVLGLGIVVVYFAAARIGLQLAFVQSNTTAIWPPTGIALAVFLIFGYRTWPTIFLAAFLVNLTTAGTVATSLGIALGNTLEGLMGAYLINRFANGRYALEKARDVFLFVILAGLFSTTISATIGVMTLTLAGFSGWTNFGGVWLTWWLGDTAGALVVAPALILWINNWRKRPNFAQLLEDVVLFYALIVASQIIFGQPPVGGLSTHPYQIMPPLVWLAMRSGQREVALAIVIVVGTALWNTITGLGPFAGLTPNQSLLDLDIFAAISSAMTLILAAVVTERRQSEQHFRSLIEHSFDAVSLINRRADVIYTSPSTERVLGYSPEEFVGKNGLDIVHEDEREEIARILGDVATKPGMATKFETRAKRKDGKIIWVECVVSNLLAEPSVRAIAVNYRDVTERKDAEHDITEYMEELAEEEAKDDALISSIGDAIIATDQSGKIIRVNKAFESLLGIKSEEALTKKTREVIVIYDEQGVPLAEEKRALNKAFAQGGRVETVHWLAKKDGTRFPANVVATPVILEGEIVGAVETIHDITKEQETERIKSDFISIASHQLRTPLTAIRWASEGLISGDLPATKVKSYMTNISLSVQRLSNLVDRMLNLSRIESGVVNILAEPIDVVKSVTSLLEEYAPLVSKSKLEMVFKDHPATLPATTDALAVRNILQNLVSNAIEYTPAGGRVEVSLTKNANTFTLAVEDSGIGIPASEYSRIFQRFGRTSNALLMKADGTGIGLYVADQAARRLGGRMWFTSEQNKGSIFYAELPLITESRLGGKRLA